MFQIIGDVIYFDGRPVAIFQEGLPASIRAVVDDMLTREASYVDIEAERARAVKFGCDIRRLLSFHAFTMPESTFNALTDRIAEYLDSTGEDEAEAIEELRRELIDVKNALVAAASQRDAYAAMLGLTPAPEPACPECSICNDGDCLDVWNCPRKVTP